MIDKWEISKSQDSKNTTKHRLLLRCEVKDILKIVKHLGAVCSRPERIVSNDYNFLIYLFEYNDLIDRKLKSVINEIQQTKVTKTISKTENEPAVDTLSIPMPELEVKVSEMPKVKEKEERDEKNISKPFGPLSPISISGRIKREEKKEEVKDEKKTDVKITQRTIEKLKLKWSIELPLNPTLSFHTLITGSHNRFAHAASMAVVENPGVMYNPILIYGPSGVGKSHFIHSMSYGLSASIGQKNIFVTNGVKFSIGVNLAIKDGFINSLEKIIDISKVIIIDDVHLMLINKDNKPFISKVLKGAMQSNKQVVFSSLFSPQKLEPLENMLDIQFSSGWMVDIKIPNPQTYRLILNQLLTNMDVKISEEHINKFFVSKAMDFRTINKLLFRVKKMEKYITHLNPSLLHQDLISMLLGEKDDLSGVSDAEVKGADLYSSNDPSSFYKWGIFAPNNMKHYSNYVTSKLKTTASDVFSLDISWNNLFIEEYNPDEVYGIPFKIGSYVLDKNINGLIVIGPPPTSALSAKEEEFKHLVENIMESLNVKTAWIYSNKLKAQSVYLNALLDLI